MKTISVIVEGGKATPGPPLAPALAPLGVNIGKVVAEINQATKSFAGIKVPVKVLVDPKTKEFQIEVGSPPTSELIKKEAGIEKGAGNREAPAGDISLEKIISIAKAKTNSLASDLKGKVKEVLGTCVSIGVTVNGKSPKEIIKEIDKGMHDSLLVG